MRTLAVPLALLALAAAASAQTASLSPSAKGGFVLDARSVAWKPSRAFRTFLAAKGREGWAAEYDLSNLPLGAHIVSASLVSSLSAVSAGKLSLSLRAYAGDGAVGPDDMDAGSPFATLAPAAWTTGRLDVAAGLQARLDAGDRYAGFSLAPPAGKATPAGSGAAWSSPSLEVAYVVDHGLAKGGWPMSGGSPSNSKVGGLVRAVGAPAESSPYGGYYTYSIVGPNGWVYISGGRSVLALDAAGALRWRFDMTRAFSPVLALSADGTLYASSDRLRAFDAATGAIRWEDPIDDGNDPGYQIQLQDEGSLLVTQKVHTVLDGHDGRRLWSRIDNSGFPTAQIPGGPLAVTQGSPGGSYSLGLYDPKTGAKVGEYSMGGQVSPTEPVVTGGTLAWSAVVPSAPRYSYTLQPRPGSGSGFYHAATTTMDFTRYVWTVPVGGGTPAPTLVNAITVNAHAPSAHPDVYPTVPIPSAIQVWSLGAAPNGLLVVREQGDTYVVGPRVRYSLGEATPFAISSDNRLYTAKGAYDLATGRKLWWLNLPGLPQATLIGPDGTLWIVFYDRIQRIR